MLSSEYRQASPVWTCGSQCSLHELSSPFTLLPFVKYAIMFLMGNSWGLRTNDGDAERACFLQCGITSRRTALCQSAGFNFCYVSYILICHIRLSSVHRLKQLLLHLIYSFVFLFLLLHILIWLVTEVVSIFKPEKKNPYFQEVSNFINTTLNREKLKCNRLLT